MRDILNLSPKRTRPLRAVLPFCLLSAVLVWIVRMPPTLIFWFGVIVLPTGMLWQVVCALLYRWLLPRCQAKMHAVGAQQLAAYMQKRLVGAYHGALSNTPLVVALGLCNLAVAVTILYDARLIPGVWWEWLAFFAFGSALFVGLIALESSKIIYDMLGVLLKPI